MNMRKYTQKELKEFVRLGMAKDITTENGTKVRELKNKKGIYQVGYSCGIYGCNGMLLKDNDGETYVITSRTSNLWLF